MILATQIVTIVSLVFTVCVALVGVVIFLARKNSEVIHAQVGDSNGS